MNNSLKILSTFKSSTVFKVARNISLKPIEIDGNFKNLLKQSKQGSINLEKNTNGIANIVINNPEKKNAITGGMMLNLYDIVSDLESWNEGRAIILSGAEGTFCAGGDRSTIDLLMDYPEGGAKMSELMQNLLVRLWNLPLISVACVEGRALGGGAEVSIACDYRIMAHDAVIGFVQAKVGLCCGWGGSVRLPNLLGRRKSLYLLASSKLLSSSDALEVGLADYVADPNHDVHQSTLEFLEPMLCADGVQLKVSYPDNFESQISTPVIILFGWAGSIHKILDKYAAIYIDYITIRFMTPVKDIYFGFGANRKAACSILNYLTEKNLRLNPLFVHSFSNGGCFIYWRLKKLLCQPENSDIKLCGTMFDSCPALTGLRRFIHVYLMIYKGSIILKYIGLLMMCMVWPFHKYYSLLLNGESFMDAMRDDPFICPQLFLYSELDDIISHLAIEKHISLREERGVNVVRKKWVDSGHVAHLVKHPEEYSRACLDFIDEALNCKADCYLD